MSTLKGLAMAPRTWTCSILSTLNPAKRTRKRDRKASHLALPVPISTQETAPSPKKPTSAYSSSQMPQKPNSRDHFDRSTPAAPPAPPKDGRPSRTTPNEGPRPTIVKGDTGDVPSITLTGIQSPRVLLAPGFSPDEGVSGNRFSDNLLRPPPRATLRRRRGTRHFPSLKGTTHGNIPESSSTPLPNGRHEVLPLYPGLPTVLCIDGGDCLVSIVKPLPEYRRDGAQPTDVAVVDSYGKTAHRVVFMGQSAFLVQVLECITAPQLPVSSNKGSTQASLNPVSGLWRMEAENCDNISNASSLYSGDLNGQSGLVIPARAKGKRGIPRPSIDSPVNLHGLQRMTQPSRSVAQPIMPGSVSQDRGFEDENVRLDTNSRDKTSIMGINSILFPPFLSPAQHILDRSPLQEPLSLDPPCGILIKHQIHGEVIESIDCNHYPEPGQVPQPPIGTGRPSRLRDMMDHESCAVLYSTRQKKEVSRSEEVDGRIIEACHETEHGHTPRLPKSIWNIE